MALKWADTKADEQTVHGAYNEVMCAADRPSTMLE